MNPTDSLQDPDEQEPCKDMAAGSIDDGPYQAAGEEFRYRLRTVEPAGQPPALMIIKIFL